MVTRRGGSASRTICETPDLKDKARYSVKEEMWEDGSKRLRESSPTNSRKAEERRFETSYSVSAARISLTFHHGGVTEKYCFIKSKESSRAARIISKLQKKMMNLKLAWRAWCDARGKKSQKLVGF